MSKSNPVLADQAGPSLVAFLQRCFARRGTQAMIAEKHAALKKARGLVTDPDKALDGSISWINGLMNRKPVAPYPLVPSLWDLAVCFFEEPKAGLQWVAAPVLYYASGQLEALVQCVGTVNFAGISAPGLHQLLRALPGAVIWEPISRGTWDSLRLRRRHFLHPADAKGRFARSIDSRDNGNCDLRMASMIARELTLPYERRRELVLQYLLQWTSASS